MEDIEVKAGTVGLTTDLAQFKTLEGNRSISQKNIDNISSSVKKIGWIVPTILVNESWEVIDGQHRLQFARDHGLPVRCQMVEGLGSAECVSMNINQANWELLDYISMYAARGSEDYQRLIELIEEFPTISITNISCAATGKASSPNEQIKGGTFKLSPARQATAREALTWLVGVLGRLNGDIRAPFKSALLSIFLFMDDVDMRRLERCLQRHVFGRDDRMSTVKGSLALIGELYNRRLAPAKQKQFVHDYECVMDKISPMWAVRWGA